MRDDTAPLPGVCQTLVPGSRQKLLPFLDQAAEQAASRGLLKAGTFWGQRGKTLRNTLHLSGSGLQDPSRLRSMQRLFPLSEEQRHFTAGSAPLEPISLAGLRCGLGICFELRFPEIFRAQAKRGMELVLLSSQWPASRVLHLETLSRARAIENQCFLLSCNACGPSTLGPPAGEAIKSKICCKIPLPVRRPSPSLSLVA